MRVGIDCSPLLMRSAGVKTYVHHLVCELRALRGNSQVAAFPYLRSIPELNHDRSGLGPRDTYLRLLGLALLNRGTLPPWTMLPDVDLFHTTNQVRRHSRKQKLSVTIHDLTTCLFPQFHLAANVAADREFHQVAKNADGVLASSHNTKSDILRILDIPADRIHVVHLGVAGSYFDVDTAAVEEVKERYSLGKPYVLFVSTIEPRKNLDTLLSAYQMLPQSVQEQFDLVVAGSAGWNAQTTLARLQDSTFRGLRYLGYVPERDMPALFAGATVFVYPSLYEGFGLPIVQAMAAGVPVVTTKGGATEEVGGDAAAYIDPQSIGDMSRTLTDLLTSPSALARLASAGRARANQFRWSECARKSWSAFEHIVGVRG